MADKRVPIKEAFSRDQGQVLVEDLKGWEGDMSLCCMSENNGLGLCREALAAII